MPHPLLSAQPPNPAAAIVAAVGDLIVPQCCPGTTRLPGYFSLDLNRVSHVLLLPNKKSRLFLKPHVRVRLRVRVRVRVYV